MFPFALNCYFISINAEMQEHRGTNVMKIYHIVI